jgi:hypothetical protein
MVVSFIGGGNQIIRRKPQTRRHSPTDRGRYLPQVCEACICMEDILQQIEVVTGRHPYLSQVYEVCQEDILTYHRYMRFVRKRTSTNKNRRFFDVWMFL